MKLFSIIKFIYKAEHPHFISVDEKVYNRWKYLIRLVIKLNKRYKPCEIYRRRYKMMENFVVIGLKYNGKNVRRRTSGFAKEFLEENMDANCIYCDIELNNDNATADHIIPISKGGNNTQVNLVVCCKKCNNERGNLDFKDFLELKNPKYKGVRPNI